MARRSFRPGHAAVVVAGIAAGALLVALVFFRLEWRGGPALVPRFDLGAFVRRLPEHARWLPGFLALAASLFAWRALVWRLVSPPPRPRYVEAYHATALGALVHNTVPGKLGPLAAAFVLSRSSREPFAAALSSQLVAKLLEMGAVVALGAAAAFALPRVEGLGRAVVVGAAVFVGLAAAAAGAALLAPRAGARLARRLP
uniref:lysylphosphatidylglycerol synthase domain-containing protein n=3 Tax=Anaeromyxobacter TaxID=161492 RepID=UPI001FAEED22